MTCTDVKRRNVKVKMPAKPRNSRIVIGVLLAVLLVCIAIGVALHLRNVEIEQQMQVQLRDDFVAELERNEGTYDAQSIVLYNTSRAKAEELAEKFGASLRMTKDGKFATLTLPEGTTILDVCRNEENIAYIEQLSADYQVSISELIEGEEDEEGNDERLPMRPTYSASDSDYELQTYLDYMNMQNVWAKYTGKGITIAVIDTGIDTDHPEFTGRISEYSYNATEDKIVKDYVLENGEYDWSLVEDEQGHGTAVTGVIAASMNSGNVVGIAPKVTIITIKAECNESGTFKRASDLVFGLYYAIERDVAVVNMSFGTYELENPFAEATQLAYDSDVICVAAAGNDETAKLCWPAADPLVIGVGALADGSWELAEYSNYGENVNVVAPGTTYTSLMGGGYGYENGTSLACPAVSGLIALYMQTHKYVMLDQVTEELYASCYDLGDLGRDWYYGFGAVDANAFLIEERGTVTYDMLTDEVDDMEGTFIRGHALQELPEPDRLYAIFDGWYYDEQCTQRVEYYTDTFYGDLTLYANWVNEDDGIPFTYVILEDGTVEIRSYTGHRRFITIPEKIEGRVVSSIGDFAFAGETNLREVGLPSGLRHIGLSAFAGCSNLVSMYIPENVTEIEDCAFAECVRLSTIAFTGESKLLSIGDNAFETCGKLRTIELPASLQSISGKTFMGTSALTAIKVQSGNQYYKSEDGVLFDISGETLVAYPVAHGTSYEIPASVKVVGDYAFYGAKVIFLDFGSIQTIGECAFAFSSVLKVNIPDSVTSMGQGAFMQSAVKELTIGAGLTEIAGGAFYRCGALRSVHIPAGIQYIRFGVIDGKACGAFGYSGLQTLTFAESSTLIGIDNLAFAGCALTEVEIPASVVYIGSCSGESNMPSYYNIPGCAPLQGAFDACGLSSITFAEDSQLRIIGDRAFAYCNLSGIDFPEGLEHLGAGAFWSNPLETVALPASLTQFDEAAFGYHPTWGVSCLYSITVAEANPVYLDINGVVYNLENTEIHAFPAGRTGEYAVFDAVQKVMPYSFAGATQLERVTLPEGLTEIGNYAFAFSGCYTYDLPSTLQYIKNGGFYSNFRLNSITLPEGLEQIAEYAFFQCSVLRTIHIPDSVLQIGRYSFAADWNLYSVTFNETAKLPRISFGAFAYCGLYSFRVPASVSTIAQGAFVGCNRLTYFTFAENSKLEAISAYMFNGCSNLRTITFEQGSALTSVQAHGLEGMDKLTQINWGDAKVTNIDNFAFRFCERLSDLTLPETVTNVGRYAFYGCKSLSELTLPAQVEHIGMFAFLGTKDLNLYLTADTMPAYLDEDWDHGIRGYYVGVTNVETQGDYMYATLTSGDVSIIEYLGSDTEIDLSVLDFGAPITAIGGSAFEDKGITRVTLPDTLTSIQAEAFAYNPLEEITIPAGVTFIGREAFTHTEIASLTFVEGSQIQTIEQYAFERTRNLTEVTLPASLTTMGRGVFQQSGLTRVTFEEGIALERIPENAFTETKLTSIALPDSVNYIDHNAFMEIPTLQSVTFGNAESISLQSNAFYHTGLTSLHIPANVTYIGEYSLVALANLTEITVDENNPYYKSVDGLLFSKDGRKLIVVPAGRTGSLTVPANVEMLGFGAFEETKLSEVKFDPNANILTLGYRAFFKANNITSIDIPKSVISIDYYAFAYCENLHTVNFAEDNQLKGIYEGAFCGDINLENITIPDTIVEISDFAFYGCSKIDRIPISENNAIKGIYSYAFAYTGIAGEFSTPETLIDIGDYAFLGTKITKLTVPDTNQGDLRIGIGAFEDCYKLEEVVLPFIGASLDDQQYSWFGYIFGAGAYEANATYVPASLKTVTITEGQTLVGFGGFAYLTSVETLNLPHSICTLYNDAFKDTTARYELTNTIMTWYQSWKIVLPYAVSGHFGPGLTGHLELAGPCILSDNTFTDGIVEIRDKAFSGCEQLTSITIPTTVTSIGNSAFSGCSGLISIDLPDSITSIGEGAFAGCANLKTVAIPDGVTRIATNTFGGCSSLTKITLPDSLTQIDIYAFSSCDSLGEITIPRNVTYISDYAFYSCDKLHLINNLSAAEFSPYGGSIIVKDADGNIHVSSTKNLTLDNDGFLWGVSNGTYTLYAYLGNEDPVTLPQSVEGNSYEMSNFSTSATHIIIPEGVTQIGYKAFKGCRELEQITIPTSVETIVDEAFADCSSLQTLIIPDSVVSIGRDAFAGCTELKTVQMSDSVTTIGFSAFENCTSLTSVKLSAGLQTIPSYVFEGCASLQMVEIPYGVTEIHGVVFSGCISLEQILIPDSVVEIGPQIAPATTDLIFYGDNPRFQAIDGIIYDAQLTEVVATLDQLTHVSIPSGVTSIGRSAFSGIESLKQVVIPYSVTSIGEYAFSHCSNLTSIAIPDSVTSIGRGAFSNCSSLTSVVIPDSVTSIGDGMFLQCTNLQNVVLPSDLTYIPNRMFEQCDSLTDINISDGVTTIGRSAFAACAGLTSLELPDSITTIDSSAFIHCTGLSEITIPNSVTFIGETPFADCKNLECIDVDEENKYYTSIDGVLYDKNITEIIAIPAQTEGTVIIPKGTLTIEYGLFNDTNITQVIIPNSVTHIGGMAFNGCAHLTSIDIPDSVTHIGIAAFQGCERLERVSIGAGVVDIGEAAFNENSNRALKEFIVSEDNAVYQSIGGILYNKALTEIISVPRNIQGEVVIPSGVTTITGFNNCSNLTSVVISDGASIIGQGAFANCTNLRYVTIPNSVTRIERLAFSSCEKLSSIILPNNLEYIGEYAFYQCMGLVSITVQNNIAKIEDEAFNRSSSLRYVKNDSDLPIIPGSNAYGEIALTAKVVVDKDGQHIYASDQNYTMDEQGFIYGEADGEYTLYAYVGESNVVYLPMEIEGNTYSINQFDTSAEHIVIPDGVTSINDLAFSWCTNVKSIELPDSIISIGESAFYFCKSLENLIIPYGVENIGRNAFSGCVSLNSIILPETVTYIGESAFRFCSGLTEVYLPESITEIPDAAFSECTSLQNIVIPDSVTIISQGAFSRCTSLQNVTIPDSVTIISQGVFSGCTSLMDIDLPDSLSYIGARAFDNTAYLNDISHWTEGTISLDGWLLKLNTETKYFDVFSYRGAAADAYDGCHLLKIAIWNSSVEGATNIETIVVKGIESNLPFNDPRHTETQLPPTVTNIIITKDVHLTELRKNPEMFEYVSGVTICVEGNEKDLRWDHNFPGWNNSNTVIYGDKWTWETFYGEQGTIVSIRPRKNSQIIRVPIMEDKEDFANIYTVSWDINGDGIADRIPATTVTDLEARPVYSATPKDYTVVFKDSETGVIYKQETLHYGDVITAPETPTRADGFLIGWYGYKEGITVINHAEFNTNWHVHKYASEVTPPTCLEIGYTTYTCNCGDTYVSDETDALGHTMGEWYQTVAPTCTTEGENRRDCDRGCGYYETEVVPANGHTPADAVEENHVDPTCTEIGGYDMVVYCTVCDAELSREHTVLDALGHTPADAVEENHVDSTCTEIGGYDMVVYCTVCDAELSREHTVLDALGHAPADAEEENHVNPTCTEIGGYDMVVYCTVCDAELSREHYDIEALGHAPATEWTEDLTPTCTAVGSKSHHCTRCDDKLDITEIPANGHSHTATVTAPTCIGKGFTSYYCHCTDFYIGDYVDALGHTEVIDEAVAPTCTATGLTEGKHCSVCHAVLVAQEVVPANGHTYESVVTAPTCAEKGYTTHTCHCGDSYVDSEVDALGHTPSDWIVDAEAQIGVAGSKHKECTTCGETLETEVIEALTEAPTTEAPTTEPEPSGGCNGTIGASAALLALLSCFAVVWRPRKDN